MSKEELLKTKEAYYEEVHKWFLVELGKWSKKHTMHVSDYTILRMWEIGSDNVYEPYSLHCDEKEDAQFANALKDYERLVKDVSELGVTYWQGMEYSKDIILFH